MNEQIKTDICLREESVHRETLASIKKEYYKAFKCISTYEEVLELNRWEETSRANEMKRYVNTLKELLVGE